MKLAILTLFCGLALFAAADEALLPEPSEPPFRVGDFPMQSGHTIEREGAPDLNFRIIDNKMRVYWIDDDGLIMEPTVDALTIRFDRRSIRETTREYHRLKRLSEDAALGSPYFLPVPHRYFVTLVLRDPGTDEVLSYRFRYLPEMNAVKLPALD